MLDKTSDPTTPAAFPFSRWRPAQLFCWAVTALSLFACVAMAVIRSDGLTQVTVTALDKTAEPHDLQIPFFDQQASLPDYQITINSTNRSQISLGAKPNESAVDGLTWQLPDPISRSDVSSIRLDDQDKLISDAIAEVQLATGPVTKGNYRFEFTSERSLTVGIQSFFKTPIGKSITAAFMVAIVLTLFFGLTRVN